MLLEGKARKKAAALCAVTMLFCLGAPRCLQYATHAKALLSSELMSVPCQQLMRTAARVDELTEEEYFDILSENASDFRMWEITYFLRMPSCESILEWYRGTSLRPYLAQLLDEDKREFEAEILEGIREIYPVQRSGEIIFRFPRLFFTAKK